MASNAEQLMHAFRSNATADVTMSLLRSRDAIVHLALMAAHLGDGQIIDGQTLTAEIDADLSALLRSYAEVEGALWSSGADGLLTRWTKRGWVHRSVDPETRIERYQLTSGAMQAVRQIRNLQRQTSIATESALSMVMAELRQIATDANPDPAARRQALRDQIAMLTARLEALEAGGDVVIRCPEPFRIVGLGDLELFDLSIGNRVLRKEHVDDGIPVYSANVRRPFGCIAESNLTDFSAFSLIWGIDGVFDWNLIPAGQPFATTDHSGRLQLRDSPSSRTTFSGPSGLRVPPTASTECSGLVSGTCVASSKSPSRSKPAASSPSAGNRRSPHSTKR